jgi:N-acetylglutamate synthase-like GNAT family acetyltransferase
MFAVEGWSLRRAVIGDAGRARDLVRAVYGKYVAAMGRESRPMTADYKAAIENHQVWIVEDGGEMLAVLVLIAEPDAMILENVAVSERLQGRGVGSRLLVFAEAEAARQGYDEVLLYTNEMMGDNAAYYARRGYEETHREPFASTQVIHMKKRVA